MRIRLAVAVAMVAASLHAQQRDERVIPNAVCTPNDTALCLSSSRYWVFAGGLTNVQVTTTVTDTQTGTVKIYTNPLGQAFQPTQDTSAFATCP